MLVIVKITVILTVSDVNNNVDQTAELQYDKRLEEKYSIGVEEKKIQESIKSNNDQGGWYYTGTVDELSQDLEVV